MRRRFQKRVYIALPEARARAHMLKLNLGIHTSELLYDLLLSYIMTCHDMT